jgi:hypothetical protein
VPDMDWLMTIQSTVTSTYNSRHRSKVASPQRSVTPPPPTIYPPRQDTSAYIRSRYNERPAPSTSRSVTTLDDGIDRTRSQRKNSSRQDSYATEDYCAPQRTMSSATSKARRFRTEKKEEIGAITEATSKAQIPIPNQNIPKLTRRASLTERIKPLAKKLSLFKDPTKNMSESALDTVGSSDTSRSTLKSSTREPKGNAKYTALSPMANSVNRAVSFRKGHESIAIGTYEGVTSPYDLDDLIKSGPSISSFSPDTVPTFASIDAKTTASAAPPVFANPGHAFLQDIKSANPFLSDAKAKGVHFSTANQSTARRSRLKELPLRRFRSSEYLPLQVASPIKATHAPRRAISVKLTPTTAGDLSFLSPVSPENSMLSLFPRPRKRASTQESKFHAGRVTESSSVYSPTSGSPGRTLDLNNQSIGGLLAQPPRSPPHFNSAKKGLNLQRIPEPRIYMSEHPQQTPPEVAKPARTPSPSLAELVSATVSGPQPDMPYDFATLSSSPPRSPRRHSPMNDDSTNTLTNNTSTNGSTANNMSSSSHSRNESLNANHPAYGNWHPPQIVPPAALRAQSPYAVPPVLENSTPQHDPYLNPQQSLTSLPKGQGLPQNPKQYMGAPPQRDRLVAPVRAQGLPRVPNHHRLLSTDSNASTSSKPPRSPWRRMFDRTLGHRKTKSDAAEKPPRSEAGSKFF